jgi:hypothetical protein
LDVDFFCRQLIFDFLSKVNENFLNIVTGVSASFEERHAELVSELLSLLRLDKFLVIQICLVAYEYALHVLPAVGMLLQLSHPVPHIIEAVLICAVVSKHNPLRVLEITRRDISVAFLAGCVPDL